MLPITDPFKLDNAISGYEKTISRLAKRTKDLTIKAEDRAEYEDACGMIGYLSDDMNFVEESALGSPSIFTVLPNDYKATTQYLSGNGTVFPYESSSHWPVAPAFYVDDNPGKMARLKVGKYPYIEWKGKPRALSLPDFPVANNFSYDQGVQLAKDEAGVNSSNPDGVNNWHMMTGHEHDYLSLLEIRGGYQSRGNDSYGKAYNKTNEYGISDDSEAFDITGKTEKGRRIIKTRPGSEPLAWHVGYNPLMPFRRTGAAVWRGGNRNYGGIPNWAPNANKPGMDHSANSDEWKSYTHGIGYTDALADGSYRFDYKEDPGEASGNKAFEIATEFLHRQTVEAPTGQSSFNSLVLREGVEDDMFLSLTLMRKLIVNVRGVLYIKNLEGLELVPYGLGYYGAGSASGPAYWNASWTRRSDTYRNISAFLASYDLRGE